ncbi:CGNR zinc finger domain-containing protein [Streptomyces sp. NPDC004520]
MRECGADDRVLPFADTSRPGRRSRCSTDRWDIRGKVREHRARTS